MPDDDNEDPAAAADDPIVELPQSKINAMMAAARRQGRGERDPNAAKATAAMDPAAIAAIVTATVQAMQPQAAARPPAAAPAAPSSFDLPSNAGLPDIFAPGAAAKLGAKGVRAALEQIWSHADEVAGRPSRPKPPTR